MSTQAIVLDAPPRGRRRSFTIGATFVLLALLSASRVAFIPNMGFVAVSAVFIGSFLAYLGLRSDGTGDVFEIIGLVSVLSFLYFCVGTFYLRRGSRGPARIQRSRRFSSPRCCSRRWASSASSWVTGGRSAKRRRPRWDASSPRASCSVFVPAVIGAVGMNVPNVPAAALQELPGHLGVAIVLAAVRRALLFRLVSRLVPAVGEEAEGAPRAVLAARRR